MFTFLAVQIGLGLAGFAALLGVLSDRVRRTSKGVMSGPWSNYPLPGLVMGVDYIVFVIPTLLAISFLTLMAGASLEPAAPIAGAVVRVTSLLGFFILAGVAIVFWRGFTDRTRTVLRALSIAVVMAALISRDLAPGFWESFFQTGDQSDAVLEVRLEGIPQHALGPDEIFEL